MNGDKNEESKDEPREDDIENLPHNLARYARSSYSRKEIEEEEEALLESDIDTPSLELENLPSTDMLENIKDDKLVKKIKEEQLIRKMKDEINSPVDTNTLGVGNIQKLQNGCENTIQEEGVSRIGIRNEYSNGVEEPEDEVVSYKTETDQESTRTDSRASEISSTHSVHYTSTSNITNSSISNGQGKVVNLDNDELVQSVIVRDHDDSSTSTSEETEEENLFRTSVQEKATSRGKRVNRNENITSKKQNKDVSNLTTIPSKIKRRNIRQGTTINEQNNDTLSNNELGLSHVLGEDCKDQNCSQHKSNEELTNMSETKIVPQGGKTKLQEINSPQFNANLKNLSMYPTVIIEELNITDKNMPKKLSYKSKNKSKHEEFSVERLQTQIKIKSDVSPRNKKIDINILPENGKPSCVNAERRLQLPESQTIDNAEVSIDLMCKPKRSSKKSHSLRNIATEKEHRRSLRNARTVNSSNSNCPDTINDSNYSTESERSEEESDINDDIDIKDDDTHPKHDGSIIVSKRGRKIGRPNYIYESSSEHTSDAECSRTASPAEALKGIIQVPKKPVSKLAYNEGCEQFSSAMTIESEEEEIVGINASDGFLNGDVDFESEFPCKYSVGELAWARVGTAPFWPCTFTHDPDLKIHSYISKVLANGLARSHRQYHVQFFGKVQRAWVKEQGLMKFEGLDAFSEAGAKLKGSGKKKSGKLLKAYFPTGDAKMKWQAAVDEMSETKNMDFEERLKHAKSLFDASVKLQEERALDKKPSKRKRHESGTSMTSTISSTSSNTKAVSPPNKKLRGNTEILESDAGVDNQSMNVDGSNIKEHPEQPSTNTSLPLKKRVCQSNESSNSSFTEFSQPTKLHSRFPDIDSLIKAIPSNKLEENRRKLKTGFKLFQLANSEATVLSKLGQNGGKDKCPEDFDKFLSRKWNALSFAERRFYQDMVRSIVSQKEEEDNTSVCSEDNEGTYILDSEDEAFKEEDDKESVASDLSSNRKTNKLPQKSRPIKDKKQSFVSPSSSTYSLEQSPITQKSASDMVGLFKKEFCCIICEETVSPKQRVEENSGESQGREEQNKRLAEDPIVKCRGGCHSNFHLSCVGENRLIKQEEWKCSECQTGKHSCFICKDTGSKESSVGVVEKCSQTGCGKYFHRLCLKKYGLWPQARYSEHALTCPGHICHTCASDNPKDPYMKYNTKLLKCIRCPTTYHSGDHCVAAGSYQITMTQIICPKHFTAKSGGKKSGGKSSGSGHFNANWCFICSKGGALICCERCPASFHKDCLVGQLEDDTLPDKYYCDNCETGRMPLYGEILWVKLGQYRWWPAQVIHPANLPSNIDKLHHDIGQFPVQFCGTNEYYWMNQGRCFLYEEGDAEGKNAVSATFGNANALNASFRRGLVEAAELFETLMAEREKREAVNRVKANSTGWQKHIKPPLYTKIKFNQPVGDCPVYKADPLDQQTCECDSQNDEPCGENSECLNCLLLCECRPSTCPAGEKCRNQRFQKRSYPKLRVTRTDSRGWGLTVHEAVKKGTFIIEYVGELITMAEFHRRIERSRQRKEEHNYYYMTMDASRMIDAGPKGNIARFMNHSCDPNCETQKWTVNGDTKVGIFALKEIPDGAELTFNYQFEVMGDVKQICLCGAKNCSGFIGEKPSRPGQEFISNKEGKLSGDKLKGTRSSIGEEKDKNNKKKKKQKKVTKTWEDLCFRCYEDGQLLMCDWKNCPKVYHLACLGREKMPREKWFCPWHHCVTCGKPAISYCIHCPNAYCSEHDNVIFDHPELARMCDEHEEDIENLIQFYRTVVGGVSTLPSNPNIQINDSALESTKCEEKLNAVEDDAASDVFGQNEDTRTSNDVHILSDNRFSDNHSVQSVVLNDIENNAINFDEEKSAVGNDCFETKCVADPALLEKIISASKKKIKKIPCGELNCGWTGKKGVLVQHYEKTHEYSTENSEMLSRLAFELAIRRRQEAASKARRLSLEIQIAQLSRSPKKSIEAIERKDHCQFISSQTNSKTSLTTTVQSSNHRIPTFTNSKNKLYNSLNQSNVDTASPSPSKVEILYKCPVCKWAFRGSLFWRHIAKKHPGHKVDKENIVKVGPAIDQTTGKASLKAKKMVDPQDEEAQIDNEVKEVKNNLPLAGIAPLNEIISSPSVQNDPSVENCPVQKDSLDRNTSIGCISRDNNLEVIGSIRSNGKKKLSSRTTAENEKAYSPGHSLCTECGKYVHSSNTARHWRSQHPHLDYSPRKFSHNQSKFQDDDNFEDSNCETPKSISSNLWPTRMESNDNQTEDLNSSNVGSNKTSNLITRSSKRIKETFTLITSDNNKENSITDKQANTEMPPSTTNFISKTKKNGQIFKKIKCGHEGCTFSARSVSSIKSHRKQTNHLRKTIDKSAGNSNTYAIAKKFKQRAIKKILHKEAKVKQEIDTGALHPNGMPRKWRSCGFEGCDYRTQYKANLNRHQNHYGHKDIKSLKNSETIKPLEKSDISKTNLSIVPPPSACLQDSTTNSSKGGKLSEDIMEDRSNTVIGRDLEGNDVMADGSIKLKTRVLATERLRETEIIKTPILTKIVDQGRFDITACVGSPEKLPSIDENMQTDLTTDNNLASQISNTKEKNLHTPISDDMLSLKDS